MINVAVSVEKKKKKKKMCAGVYIAKPVFVVLYIFRIKVINFVLSTDFLCFVFIYVGNK